MNVIIMNLYFWNDVKSWLYRLFQRWVFQHDLAVERQYRYDDCVAKFRERLIKNNIPVNQPAPGEEEYIRFWQQFDKRVEPYTYRFFSRIVGPNPHIVPEDVADAYIERVLNPVQYRDLYNDKNFFDKIISEESIWPKTLLRRMDGVLLSSEYECVTAKITGGGHYQPFAALSADMIAKHFGNNDKVVLKPSTDSHSGQGVKLLNRKGNVFVDKGGQVVDGKYLYDYGKNFVIQEVIEQHPYMAQFCKSSCNTMRVMTYRSIKDESINIFGAVLRIGHEGSFVDNLFAGGGFATIDVQTGKLGNCIYDEFGRKYDDINGVNFSSTDYRIPFWNEVCYFAKSIGQQIPHCRLIAMDITYDVHSKPRLIEFNVDGFNWSFVMYAGKTNFDDKFDEVIEYCLKNKNRI